MNLILYLSLLKIVILLIIPLVNSNESTKKFICQRNRIIIKNESSKLNATSESTMPSILISSFRSKRMSSDNENIQEKKFLYKGKTVSELIHLGIQMTIQKSNHEIVKDSHTFLENDLSFKNILLSINEDNFQAFAPYNFFNLRSLYNISEDFNLSFHTSLLFKKFNDNYYYTKDNKFSVNIITKEKFMFITSLLSKYFSHICQNKLSLLPRIAGLYYLKTEKLEYYILVTSHILQYALSNLDNQLYYINGTNGIGSLKINSTDKPSFCYLEKDFNLNYPNGLQISSEVYNNLRNVLVKDIVFLTNLNISDYIFVLLVTFRFKSNEKSKDICSLVKKLNEKIVPSQNMSKNSIIATVGNLNLILNIGIDNVFQNINDQRECMFICHRHCNMKYPSQNITNYGLKFFRKITRKVLKPFADKTTD